MNVILETLGNDVTRHAAIIHFPIVLFALTFLMAFAAAIAGTRSTALRWCAVIGGAMLLLSTLAAVGSGEDAEEHLTQDMAAEAWTLVEDHEEMAGRTWMFAGGALLLLVIGLGKREPVRGGAAWLAVLTLAGGAGWITQVAHRGGKLVYEYGAGTPNPVEMSMGEGDPAEWADARLTFYRDELLPLLQKHCLDCHNPSDHDGDIDFTRISTVLTTRRRTGPVVVPGHPESSRLMKVIRREVLDFEMPPDDTLTDAEVSVFERWILEGAVWE